MEEKAERWGKDVDWNGEWKGAADILCVLAQGAHWPGATTHNWKSPGPLSTHGLGQNPPHVPRTTTPDPP